MNRRDFMKTILAAPIGAVGATQPKTTTPTKAPPGVPSVLMPQKLQPPGGGDPVYFNDRTEIIEKAITQGLTTEAEVVQLAGHEIDFVWPLDWRDHEPKEYMRLLRLQSKTFQRARI